jgi:biotin carboxyl carrier protein
MIANANGEDQSVRRAFKVVIEGKRLSVVSHEEPLKDPGRGKVAITVDGRPGRIDVEYEERFEELRTVTMPQTPGMTTAGSPVALGEPIRAPMPGKVLEVLVNEGDLVNAGEAVIILEAMKMQNEIRAPRKGVIGKVHCALGESISANDMLMEFRS